MVAIIEAVASGVIVSIFNKYFLHRLDFFTCCPIIFDHFNNDLNMDDNSSTNTTITSDIDKNNDTSFGTSSQRLL